MSDHDDFHDFCDDCDECWECYEEGYEDGRSARRSGGSRSNSRGSSDGCYIATAVYGSYDCPEVWVLRRFRDCGLRKSAAGRWAVRAYYAVSPGLVARFGNYRTLCLWVKWVLDRFVTGLKRRGFSDTPYGGR